MAIALLGCPPKYPKCKKDSHCEKQSEVCVEGACQQCRDDDQCGDGTMCKGGVCVQKAECASEGDCKGGKICRSGKCQLECEGANDCGSGMSCTENRCVDGIACSGPSDCSAGLECSGGRCIKSDLASRTMGCETTPVYFEFNRSRLTGDARDSLQSNADCIKTKSGVITVEGHCDDRGTVEYNLALGDRRARAVRDYMVSLGVPRSKLRIVSKGELEPEDSGNSERAWAKNRRAEFE